MIDTSLPPWLQRNVAQKESFDPSPWLNEAFNQNVQRAKLPLQLQQYELQNKELQLTAEHQGLQNDILNQELEFQKSELPAFKAALQTASKVPGGATAIPVPSFQSKKYNDLWHQRLQSDADTVVGKALSQKAIGQKLAVAKIVEMGGKVPPQGPDGFYDDAALADAATQALTAEAMRKDPTLRVASEISDLKSQLRASVIATQGVAEVTPELTAELERQQQLKDKLSVLETKVGGTAAFEPQLRKFGDKTFVFNPKNGALHEVSKDVSKKEFIANHVSSWMKDNLWTAEEASKALGEFYDKNLAPEGGSEPSKPSAKTSPIKLGTIKVDRNGVRAAYQGGPENDPSSWKVLP